MPTIITAGAASARGYGFGASSSSATYIEDVFSTWLYTGTGSALTVTNGVDLSTKGGLVWIKDRTVGQAHRLFDTARGVNVNIISNSTISQSTLASSLTAFNTNGFSIGTDTNVNTNGQPEVTWTFRKQPKFFDVVTYTGTGSAQNIAHNLGSVPGCIMVKRLDATSSWRVYHRSLTSADYVLTLNQTSGEGSLPTTFNSTAPTSSVFTVGTSTDTNASGGTYVAYLFAHNAGGFGASGTDNVISCGIATADGSNNFTVNLGWEPQWLLLKVTSGGSNWFMFDNMRGFGVGTNPYVSANSALAESTLSTITANATGFSAIGQFGAGSTVAYIAIRRGPMKTPTNGTSVFSPIASSAATGTALTTSFSVDMQITAARSTTASRQVVDRLRGVSTNATGAGQTLLTNSTAAEAADAGSSLFWDNTGFQMPLNWGGISDIFWNFRRAPGFFDVVCYTGTGVSGNINHNLGVSPEFMIFKSRNASFGWAVSIPSLGTNRSMQLQSTLAAYSSELYTTSQSTTTVTLTNESKCNASGNTFVAYLFATCPGVSKVGSYTGSGTTKQIDCGFTGGARFVLIKRTDSTGDWYVWDSARGIVAANDPYLLLNSTAAEVTNTDYIDTYAAGFEISSTAPAAINANGGSFIYLAIA